MKPNIIYLLSDQHNQSVMGAAGDPWARTPNLDRLYARGTALDSCYCAAPLCVPSRSSILTGLLPTGNGVYNNMQCLPSDKATFVNSMTVGGYETVLCGRMHFVGNDQRHGYEKRLVGDITPCSIGGDNEAEIYGEFKRSSGQNLTSIKKSGAGRSAVLDYDEDVASEACRFLKERTDERPLFMTVGFYGPHCPYIAPEELYQHYYECLPEIHFPDQEEKDAMHPAIRKWYANRNMEKVTPEDVRRIRAAYYGMVEYVDGLIGRILETVEKTAGWENTIVVYGSDHGDNIGEHGLFWKTNFYEGSSHVPMVYVWPGVFPEGGHVGGFTSLLDIAPTFLELSGCQRLPDQDGISLVSNLKKGTPVPSDREVVSMCSDIKGDDPSAMLLLGSYKLVKHAGYQVSQLFDLERDPGELEDLGARPEYGETVRDLENRLGHYWNGEQALERLKKDLFHFRMMKQWYDIVKPDVIEEWRGDPEQNYLV